MFKTSKILIVDDNSMISFYLKNQLEQRGFTNIEITHQAKGILSCLESKSYQLVICNESFPEMTIDDLILRVRLRWYQEQPCFMIISEFWDASSCIFNYVSSYSSQPIEIESFVKKITELLFQKQKESRMV